MKVNKISNFAPLPLRKSASLPPSKLKPKLTQKQSSAINLAQANQALKVHQQNLLAQRPIGIEYNDSIRILLKKMEFSKAQLPQKYEWTKYIPKEIEMDNWLPKDTDELITYDKLLESEEGEEGGWDSLKAVVGKRYKEGPKGYQAIFDIQNEEIRL